MSILTIDISAVIAARRQWLREALAHGGTKQAALACAAGITSGTLTNYKKGHRPIRDAHWSALRAAVKELTSTP